MQTLKNAALFLLGVLLIVFGFKANTARMENSSVGQKENAAAKNDLPATDGNQSPSGSAVPAEKAVESKTPAPEKRAGKKAARAKQTRLEKAMPEKATGSQ